MDSDPDRLPMALVRDANGEPVRVRVPVEDEDVAVQAWRVDVGRVPLYLLDTDVPENSVVARWITSRLYEGNSEMRLAQYAVLGVGATRTVPAGMRNRAEPVSPQRGTRGARHFGPRGRATAIRHARRRGLERSARPSRVHHAHPGGRRERDVPR